MKNPTRGEITLPTCPKCGKETSADDEFCQSCGAPLKDQAQTTTSGSSQPTQPTKERRPSWEQEDYCYGPHEPHYHDLTGLVSFGLFLLIIGIVFVANINLVSQFNSWGNSMSEAQKLLRPPQEIINSAVLFFALVGLSDFFVAGLRFVLFRRLRRALRSVFSGVALLAFSYLIYLYGQRTIRIELTIAYEIVVIGILVMVYAIIRHFL